MTQRAFITVLLACLAASMTAVPAVGAAANQLTAAEKAAGWKLLFDGQSTTGWRCFKKTTFPAKGWRVEDGWLHCLGQDGGDIITDAEFDSFEFSWEWRLAAGGNSGVKYLVTETRSGPTAHEYQMIDDAQNDDAKLRNGRRVTASFYDVLKPVGAKLSPMGQVNQSRIVVRGGRVEHWLNGAKVLDYECGSDALKAAIADSKFKSTPGFGHKIKGHVLLQDHHCDVWFRHLKVRELQ
ncbi:MAG: DUF1080 domain-containing protein [Verrucomicrobia bacterium]|nr:DUF1080 domain-containing protein [Verrucomicrobiota bacterium]